MVAIHNDPSGRLFPGIRCISPSRRRAARLAGVAHGGQILVSETAAALVQDWLAPGVALADLGVHRLKDLGRPERIFQLNAAGLQAGFPPLRSLGNPALANNLRPSWRRSSDVTPSSRRSGAWSDPPAWSR
jgi:hypothetical protein